MNQSISVALLKEENLFKNAKCLAASMISAEEGCNCFDKNAPFFNDLCVYGHDRNLEKVLQAIRKHGLSINSSKCDFYKE